MSTTLIRAARERLGLSQAALARRLGVTPGNVSQLETAEHQGRIRLDTLTNTLAAAGLTLHLSTVPAAQLRPVSWDPGVFPAIHTTPDQTFAAFRTRRIRAGAITADALVAGNALPWEALMVIADAGPLQTDQLADWWQAVNIANTYDKYYAAGLDPTWQPHYLAADGKDWLPDPAIDHPVERAVTWAAAMIANGVTPLIARYVANAALLRQGRHWIALQSHDRHEYANAVALVQMTGNATPFCDLMAARYGEEA